jgi:RNA ligase (TIGR02306 family)
MSSLIVEVCSVEEVAIHQNADRLEKIRVKNWWCIAPKGRYTIGDRVVYLPPDSIIPEELAERWGIAKYCAPVARGIDGQRPPGLRIRASRFRGEPSFGCLQDLDDPTWPVGHDVKEYYNVTKWEPPVKCLDGDAAPPVSAFHAYTDIENIGNFPDIIQAGEEVVITEKIHGTNSRVGIVLHVSEEAEGYATWQLMAGSHGTRRKEFNEKGIRSKYWFPFSINGDEHPMEKLLKEIKNTENAQQSVICFGEIFGPGIQDMHYGQKGLAYRIFDIAVDGKYLDWDKVVEYVYAYNEFDIKTVPALYRGPFSMDVMNQLVDGPTTVIEDAEKTITQAFKGREGVVVKPVVERFDHKLGGSGRVILKYISVDYHDRKNSDRTEDH